MPWEFSSPVFLLKIMGEISGLRSRVSVMATGSASLRRTKRRRRDGLTANSWIIFIREHPLKQKISRPMH